MTLVQRHAKELRRAMKRAIAKHGNVRDAARAVGLPRSTFHDKAITFGLKMVRP